LDEATLSPAIFFELKRLVDKNRRENKEKNLNIWITGSNQTLRELLEAKAIELQGHHGQAATSFLF